MCVFNRAPFETSSMPSCTAFVLGALEVVGHVVQSGTMGYSAVVCGVLADCSVFADAAFLPLCNAMELGVLC